VATLAIFIRRGELEKLMGHFYENVDFKVGGARVTAVTRAATSSAKAESPLGIGSHMKTVFSRKLVHSNPIF